MMLLFFFQLDERESLGEDKLVYSTFPFWYSFLEQGLTGEYPTEYQSKKALSTKGNKNKHCQVPSFEFLIEFLSR